MHSSIHQVILTIMVSISTVFKLMDQMNHHQDDSLCMKTISLTLNSSSPDKNLVENESERLLTYNPIDCQVWSSFDCHLANSFFYVIKIWQTKDLLKIMDYSLRAFTIDWNFFSILRLLFSTNRSEIKIKHIACRSKKKHQEDAKWENTNEGDWSDKFSTIKK